MTKFDHLRNGIIALGAMRHGLSFYDAYTYMTYTSYLTNYYWDRISLWWRTRA